MFDRVRASRLRSTARATRWRRDRRCLLHTPMVNESKAQIETFKAFLVASAGDATAPDRWRGET